MKSCSPRAVQCHRAGGAEAEDATARRIRWFRLKFMQRLAALVRRARLAPAVGPFLDAEGQLSGAESGDL